MKKIIKVAIIIVTSVVLFLYLKATFSYKVPAYDMWFDSSEEHSEEDESHIIADINEIYQFPLLDQLPSNADAEDYCRLQIDKKEYRVKKGDNLWNIAKKYYGTGTKWELIQSLNADIVEDKDLLLIDTVLQLTPPEYLYIKKQEETEGGIWSEAYEFDMPMGWVYGTDKLDACIQTISSTIDETRIFFHITETRFKPNEFTEQWESFKEQVKASAEKTDGGNLISVPEFETYYTDNGLDLYLFTFTYQKDSYIDKYAVCYLLGENYQAEFFGIQDSKLEEGAPNILDLVRYMAATYVDKEGERILRHLKYKQYIGADTWPWDSFHNPFAFAMNYRGQTPPEFTGEDYDLAFLSPMFESSIRDLCEWYYEMDLQECEEFRNRSVRASDLAWITELAIEESPIPGRDRIVFNRYRLNKDNVVDIGFDYLEDLQGMVNLQKITLELGNIHDFSPLANMKNLTDISIAAYSESVSLDWIKEMPQLKSFVFEASDIPGLYEYGYSKEEGTAFQKGTEADRNQGAEQGSLDCSIFSACPNLEHLELTLIGMIDLSFLEELPNLYYFNLRGYNMESPEALERQQMFTEQSYPQIECLVVDDNWLRNPE